MGQQSEPYNEGTKQPYQGNVYPNAHVQYPLQPAVDNNQQYPMIAQPPNYNPQYTGNVIF